MHINLLSIPFRATDSDRDDDQRILGHKVPNTSFGLLVLARRMRRQVELERDRQQGTRRQ